jgi:hypothetical protein
VPIELPSSDDIFSEAGTVRHPAPDLRGHLQTPTEPEARDPNPTMDLNNSSPRYNTGGTFLLTMRAPPYLLTHILNSLNSIGQSLGFRPGSFRLRIGDAPDQVISELMPFSLQLVASSFLWNSQLGIQSRHSRVTLNLTWTQVWTLKARFIVMSIIWTT